MENLTVKELRELAKKLGLRGYSRLRKQELITLITPAFNEEAERMVETALLIKDFDGLKARQPRASRDHNGQTRYFGDVFSITFGYYDYNSSVGGGKFEKFTVWYGQTMIRKYVYGEKIETAFEMEV